jgi:TetR/AcrR family transcriptional regulator, regulator of cefoperazone and chloramphenicol sensitivity
MMRQIRRRALSVDRSKTEDDRVNTREHLLEAAGHVFAKKGFERSTAKEICERAGTNAAAVNYHFGGIEALYAAVLEEARNRIFSVREIGLAIAGKTAPEAKLEAAINVVIKSLLGPVSSSWALQLFGRDMVTVSPTARAAKLKLMLPGASILRELVGELMGLPEDHPAVARGCMTLMAPICILILGERRIMKGALPSLGLAAADAPALARHMVDYALAGLEATARKARKGNTIPGRMKAIGRKPVAQ